MGTGQFCTNPSLVLLVAGEATEQFIAGVRARFDAAPARAAALLGRRCARWARASPRCRRPAPAWSREERPRTPGYRFGNTLLRVSGDAFLAAPERLQTEAFGNAALFVVARDASQLAALVETLEGSLTGGFYTDTRGSDDALYAQLEPLLRPRVGRLLNDKMPTGVAVTPAMNHGGPYPSTGHPGFTAVGIPAALRRFAMLQCYDNVRPSRLPALLRDQPPNDKVFRLIDGEWRRGPAARRLSLPEGAGRSALAAAIARASRSRDRCSAPAGAWRPGRGWAGGGGWRRGWPGAAAARRGRGPGRGSPR